MMTPSNSISRSDGGGIGLSSSSSSSSSNTSIPNSIPDSASASAASSPNPLSFARSHSLQSMSGLMYINPLLEIPTHGIHDDHYQRGLRAPHPSFASMKSQSYSTGSTTSPVNGAGASSGPSGDPLLQRSHSDLHPAYTSASSTMHQTPNTLTPSNGGTPPLSQSSSYHMQNSSPYTSAQANGGSASSSTPSALPAALLPSADLPFWIGTWNMGAKEMQTQQSTPSAAASSSSSSTSTSPFSGWIPTGYRMYVIGLQESISDSTYVQLDDYFASPQFNCMRLHIPSTQIDSGTVLGHVRVEGRGDGSFLHPKYTSIAIWIARSAKPYITYCASGALSLGMTQGSKGGAAVAVKILDTIIVFVSCHLSSTTLASRRMSYTSLIESVGNALGDRYFQLLEQFHHCFFLGDLNYRLREGFTAPEAVSYMQRRDVPGLFQHDELQNEMSTTLGSFARFIEAPIDFYPTYKKHEQRKIPTPSKENIYWVHDVYKTIFKQPWYKSGNTAQRVPSWCDRIIRHSLADQQDRIRLRQYHPDEIPDEKAAYEASSKHTHPKPRIGGYGGTCTYRALDDGLSGSDHTAVSCGFQLTLPRYIDWNLRPTNSSAGVAAGVFHPSNHLQPTRSASSSISGPNSPIAPTVYIVRLMSVRVYQVSQQQLPIVPLVAQTSTSSSSSSQSPASNQLLRSASSPSPSPKSNTPSPSPSGAANGSASTSAFYQQPSAQPAYLDVGIEPKYVRIVFPAPFENGVHSTFTSRQVNLHQVTLQMQQQQLLLHQQYHQSQQQLAAQNALIAAARNVPSPQTIPQAQHQQQQHHYQPTHLPIPAPQQPHHQHSHSAVVGQHQPLMQQQSSPPQHQPQRLSQSSPPQLLPPQQLQQAQQHQQTLHQPQPLHSSSSLPQLPAPSPQKLTAPGHRHTASLNVNGAQHQQQQNGHPQQQQNSRGNSPLSQSYVIVGGNLPQSDPSLASLSIGIAPPSPSSAPHASYSSAIGGPSPSSASTGLSTSAPPVAAPTASPSAAIHTLSQCKAEFRCIAFDEPAQRDPLDVTGQLPTWAPYHFLMKIHSADDLSGQCCVPLPRQAFFNQRTLEFRERLTRFGLPLLHPHTKQVMEVHFVVSLDTSKQVYASMPVAQPVGGVATTTTSTTEVLPQQTAPINTPLSHQTQQLPQPHHQYSQSSQPSSSSTSPQANQLHHQHQQALLNRATSLGRTI